MLGLPQLKARIDRLSELTQGLVREVHLWRAAESPLLPHERHAYLGDLQTAIAAEEEARVTLAAVVKRLESLQPESIPPQRPPA